MSDFFNLTFKPDLLMDKHALANLCKALRDLKGLSQKEVAEKVGTSRGNGKKISKQSVSLAENPDRGGFDSLRIEIIEMLSDRKISGPYWKFEPDSESQISEEVG